MHEGMTEALAKYEDASRSGYRVERETREAQEEMDRLCAKERRTLRWRVKKIMREARPGWSLVYDGHDCRAAVDHRPPWKASVSVSVRLLYCAGRRRGEVRLYGDFEELDALLEELRRTVTANAPREGQAPR